MKRNVSVVCVKFRFNILINGKIIKELPLFGSEWDILYITMLPSHTNVKHKRSTCDKNLILT